MGIVVVREVEVCVRERWGSVVGCRQEQAGPQKGRAK